MKSLSESGSSLLVVAAVICSALVSFSSASASASVNKRDESPCVKKSKAAVLADVKTKKYFLEQNDGSGKTIVRKISRVSCETGKFIGKPANFCQVSASFGAEVGAGDVSFATILDQSCQNVLSVVLLGEE